MAAKYGVRTQTIAGLVCLVISLLLMPMGVKGVRADDQRSVAPVVAPDVTADLESPAATPIIEPSGVDPAASEVAPVLRDSVLNTRGCY